jgi:hypothetical protein
MRFHYSARGTDYESDFEYDPSMDRLDTSPYATPESKSLSSENIIKAQTALYANSERTKLEQSKLPMANFMSASDSNDTQKDQPKEDRSTTVVVENEEEGDQLFCTFCGVGF